MNTLSALSALWTPLVAARLDRVPAAKDVTAGWVAFWVFIALVVAVALLGYSLTRHLRKARSNADLGVFDSDDKPRQSAS
jgi:ABC-type uncharacterized transport system permease subunit